MTKKSTSKGEDPIDWALKNQPLNKRASLAVRAEVRIGGYTFDPKKPQHMIASKCTSEGTSKWCTKKGCGWRIDLPREDNWGDIRKASTAASRHLMEANK